MTVLSAQTIRELCEGTSPPLVSGFKEDRLRSAGYDLSVGSEYVLGDGKGSKKVRTLSREGELIKVPPHAVLLVRTAENVVLPDNLVAHLSLKLDVLLQGLIMTSQSQVDAGYKGGLYILLYNLNRRPVFLNGGDAFVRTEFALLDDGTRKPYSGDYTQDSTLEKVLPGPIGSGLARLHHQLRSLKRQIFRFGFVAAVGLLIAVIGLGITYLVPFIDNAATAKARADQLDTQVARLQDRIDELDKIIASIQEQGSQ